MNDVTFIDVYYNLSQALIGLMTDNIRAITFEFSNKRSDLKIRVFTENEAADIDRENMYLAASEAEGMLNQRINYDLDFIVKEDKISLADKLDVWLFMRYDPKED